MPTKNLDDAQEHLNAAQSDEYAARLAWMRCESDATDSAHSAAIAELRAAERALYDAHMTRNVNHWAKYAVAQ